MAGRLLACVIVLGRVTGIVYRVRYPYRPAPPVHLSVPNNSRKKAAMIGGLCFACWLVL